MDTLFNLRVDGINREEMESRKIEFRRLLSELNKKSHIDSKPTECLLCGHPTTGFCHSHSVPASFLRNIGIDGKVFTNNKIIDSPLLSIEQGINNSGTFQVICRDCDGKAFQEYENPNNYNNHPAAKMLAQIAMKNYLKSIGKRRHEIALYENAAKKIIEMHGATPPELALFEHMNHVNRLDLSEFTRGFKRAKKIIDKGWIDEYYIIFFKRLEYVVPYAFQGELSLHFDIEGKTINNVYNHDEKYELQPVHVSVFPLKEFSVVMLFVDSKHKRYRQFAKQLNKLSSEDQLAIINFIIFSLSEDVFISRSIHDDYLFNEEFRDVVGVTSLKSTDTPDMSNEILRTELDYSKRSKIPNFLLMKHCG